MNEFIHEAIYAPFLLCFSFVHCAVVSPPCVHPHAAAVVGMSLFSYFQGIIASAGGTSCLREAVTKRRDNIYASEFTTQQGPVIFGGLI